MALDTVLEFSFQCHCENLRKVCKALKDDSREQNFLSVYVTLCRHASTFTAGSMARYDSDSSESDGAIGGADDLSGGKHDVT